MATNFPASLDSLTNPTSSDSLNSPSHSAQHANSNDAIEALQAKVGVDSSAVTTSLDYRVGQLEAGGGGMTVSSTAPSSPAEGDMWYDDTSGRTYVYYDDGSSQQWVEFGAPPSGIGKILQVVSTTKTDTLDSPPHDEQHADANDAIEALQAKVGVDSSAVTSSLDYRVGSLETFPIQLNGQTVSADYTIPSGYNGVSAGPVTIADGVTVTVSSGSAWAVV